MSCRESNGGRLTTALARDHSGLRDVQVLNTLHRLTRRGHQLELELEPEVLIAPSTWVLEAWLNEVVDEALRADPDMSSNRRQRLEAWVEGVRQEGPPSLATWHAWQNLDRETRQSSNNLATIYRHLADQEGVSEEEIAERSRVLQTQYDRLPRSQRPTPASYDPSDLLTRLDDIITDSDTRRRDLPGSIFTPSSAISLPQDQATMYALSTLLAQSEARTTPPATLPSPSSSTAAVPSNTPIRIGPGSGPGSGSTQASTPRPILLLNFNHNTFSHAAYDPDSATLEVGFNNGSVYQYEAVPPHIIEEWRNNPAGAALYFSQNIRQNYAYQRLDRNARDSLRSFLRSSEEAASNVVMLDSVVPPSQVTAVASQPPTTTRSTSANTGTGRRASRPRSAQIMTPALDQVTNDLRANRQSSQQAQQQAAQNEAQAQAQAQMSVPQYGQNMRAFQSVYEAARRRKARGEAPIPYITTGNATGGLGAREGGRGFGVELEFDLAGVANQEAALIAIGQELHAANITPTGQQQRYHSNRGDYSNWRFERDSSVSGEIISPVLYDEPQTWERIAKVCEIVERHGGKATARTGGHVHVSCGDYDHTPSNHQRLLNTFKQNEDVLYRLSQNPSANQHRGMRYCAPNSVPSTPYTSIALVQQTQAGHSVGLNFGWVSGSQNDHVEYRMWDGSLDPAVIQTQVKMSLALTQHAFAQGANPTSTSTVATTATSTGTASSGNSNNSAASATGPNPRVSQAEALGTHQQRSRSASNNRPRRLTGSEWEEDTSSFRGLLDQLFTRAEDKEQVASLFAVTKWQKPSR